MAGQPVLTPQLALVSAVNFLGFLNFGLLMSTVPGYTLTIGASESMVGAGMALLTLSAAVFRLFFGREIDRRGGKGPLLVSAAVLAAATLAHGLAEDVYWLLFVRLVYGFAWGGLLAAVNALAVNISPPSRRGEALGYFTLAMNVASASGPGVGLALVAAYGYGRFFALAAAVAATGMLLSAWVAGCAVGQKASAGKFTLISRPAAAPSAVMLLVGIGAATMITFVPLLGRVTAETWVGLFYAISSVATILARPIGGRISDFCGRQAAIMPGIGLVASSLLLLALSLSLPVFVAAAVIYGAGLGFAHTALMALVADRVPAEERGAGMAMFYSAFDSGIGIGSLALGAVLQHWGFAAVFAAAAVASGAALVLAPWCGGRQCPVQNLAVGEANRPEAE